MNKSQCWPLIDFPRQLVTCRLALKVKSSRCLWRETFLRTRGLQTGLGEWNKYRLMLVAFAFFALGGTFCSAEGNEAEEWLAIANRWRESITKLPPHHRHMITEERLLPEDSDYSVVETDEYLDNQAGYGATRRIILDWNSSLSMPDGIDSVAIRTPVRSILLTRPQEQFRWNIGGVFEPGEMADSCPNNFRSVSEAADYLRKHNSWDAVTIERRPDVIDWSARFDPPLKCDIDMGGYDCEAMRIRFKQTPVQHPIGIYKLVAADGQRWTMNTELGDFILVGEVQYPTEVRTFAGQSLNDSPGPPDSLIHVERIELVGAAEVKMRTELEYWRLFDFDKEFYSLRWLLIIGLASIGGFAWWYSRQRSAV